MERNIQSSERSPTKRQRESRARGRHTNKYWREEDKESYRCPDCDRGIEEVRRFEVHHIDGDPLNGDDANLVALCWECHQQRHGNEINEWRTLEQWKGAIERGELLENNE